MLILALVLVLKPPYPHAKAAPIKKQIAESTVEAELPAVQPTPQPQPQPVATTEQAVVIPQTYHSDDFYMEYIFQHESSGNPYAVNAIGCTGLGQACPASKLLNICPNLGDVACQIQFFTNYAVTRYGSWSGAYNFWVNNHWW